MKLATWFVSVMEIHFTSTKKKIPVCYIFVTQAVSCLVSYTTSYLNKYLNQSTNDLVRFRKTLQFGLK